jgi:hypothetical protein
VSSKSQRDGDFGQYLSQLIERQIAAYQQTSAERHRLHLQEWDSEGDYRTLHEVELFADYIAGYMARVTEGDWVKSEDVKKAIQDLQGYRIFDIPGFVEWYFSSASDYPKLKAYIELLDYSRLLTIEYLVLYQLDTED